jgi:DNA ligase-1
MAGTQGPESASVHSVPFSSLAELSQRLSSTRKRLELVALLADFLKALPPDDMAPAVLILLGRPAAQDRATTMNVSAASLVEALVQLAPPAEAILGESFSRAADFGEGVRIALERVGYRPQPPPLSIAEVQNAFSEVAAMRGAQSRAGKRNLLAGLLSRCSPSEAALLAKALVGEMRHGVGEGLMVEAIARAAGMPADKVRRAAMFQKDIGQLAADLISKGAEAVSSLSARLFAPLRPMLAHSADSVASAVQEMGLEVALEYKMDGARVQIHRDGERVETYSRALDPVTQSLPEIAAQALVNLIPPRAIVEGEVIPVDASGRPLPFQELMRRFRRVHDLEQAAREVPVRLYLFDLLYADENPWFERPYAERWEALESSVSDRKLLVPRLVPRDLQEAQRFYQRAVGEGYEGVMVKRLDSIYTPGVRGKLWMKVKAVVSVDLVIVAADWGYGRRKGWLSNYHLAARDQQAGSPACSLAGKLMEVGKTFKGLTDEEFEEMTSRLLSLKTRQSGGTVWARPEVVVEVEFNNVQRSPHYESGVALRFARVKTIRRDKKVEEIDTLQTLRKLARGGAPEPQAASGSLAGRHTEESTPTGTEG